MHYIYSGENHSYILDGLKGTINFIADVPKLIFEYANFKPTKNIFSIKND